MFPQIMLIVGGVILLVLIGFVILVARCHRKVPQGRALIRTGFGGTKVVYDSGMFVVPVLHKVEEMDISIKTIEVGRTGSEGLICQDNLRADIKVVFFVRVNKDKQSILEVAQAIGCVRASKQETLNNLFDAKFSEALKTVGKQFDLIDLYTERNKFKNKILETIGTDLNGYVLDDCAIDYLEQTPITALKQDNILDSEGIKKIEELTSIQIEKTNFIRREREKTIKQQDVEAREAILQLELQQEEKEERQKRALTILKSEQNNEAEQLVIAKNLETELKRKEAHRQEGIAEENKEREIIVARKNKERTEAVENERIEIDRLLEVEKKERSVGEARIEKEKVLEAKKRDIQAIIKERKAEEKKTIEEDQKIQDTIQLAEAERERQVTMINVQRTTESQKVEETRRAEAEKAVAEIKAQQIIIEADAKKAAQQKEAEARKIAAEAKAAEEATVGLAEAEVMQARAEASELEGSVEARLIEQKALAEAKAIEAKAEANRKQGLAEAEVNREKGTVEAQLISQKGTSEASIIELRLTAEAKGLAAKAEAMKALDGVGREHEEYKLRLEQERQIALAEIEARRAIAEAQSRLLGQSLSNARIDIVGGETQFFDSLLNSINKGKSVDRLIDNSQHLQDAKAALLGNGVEQGLFSRLREFAQEYNIGSDTLRDLSISALLSQLYGQVSGNQKDLIRSMMDQVSSLGINNQSAADLLG